MLKKDDLVTRLAYKSKVSHKEAKQRYNDFMDVLKEAVTEDDVQLLGFGTFHPRERKMRMGKSKRNGKPVIMMPTKTITFAVSYMFRSNYSGYDRFTKKENKTGVPKTPDGRIRMRHMRPVDITGAIAFMKIPDTWDSGFKEIWESKGTDEIKKEDKD